MSTNVRDSGQSTELAPHHLPLLTIIGVGAAAGGLAALRTFLRALPVGGELTFVVLVHLPPEQAEVLVEQVQSYTTMPVVAVTTRVQMQPAHVYLIAPVRPVMVSGDMLVLTDPPPGERAVPLDAFFRSLAAAHSDSGVVILSGAGNAGAVGLRAVKEKGGIVLVQDPDEAEYDTMPRSAIATGVVDVVAPAAELATQLVTASQRRVVVGLPADLEELPVAAEYSLQQILTLLRVRTGHDFSGYKPTMLLRRLERRLSLLQIATLAAYQRHLRRHDDEIALLVRDLLIQVTAFFRDPEAWQALAATVIPQLFVGKGPADTIRVWSVGCATGEEAYSIAMLLLAYAATLDDPPTFQIFASDVGQAALIQARTGAYPAAIAADIDPIWLARFFTKDNSHYQVRPELREPILFTQHNLLEDPPFSKLDLIICRNLLIYLQRDLQEKVLNTFHYALCQEVGRSSGVGTKENAGYLFLGNAETAEGSSCFTPLDPRHGLYQSRPQRTQQPLLPALRLWPRPPQSRMEQPVQEEAGTTPVSAGEEHERYMETAAPPSLLVDREQTVLHLSETVGRYLRPPAGTPTLNVVKLVRRELQAPLSAALLAAFAEGRMTLSRPVPVAFDGIQHRVALLVRPQRSPEGEARALIFFLEDEAPLATSPSAIDVETVAPGVEAELRHTQGLLHRLREEYETKVEELRGANEELQSTNEEYKSTLEELETSREELQSINEELQAVNQELKHKIEEVTQAQDDLQNLLAATDIATLFLDRSLCITRYTPRATELFNLMPLDKGRPLAHLRTNLLYEQFHEDAQRVLATLIPAEQEVQDQAGHWFRVRMRPYSTQSDKINGVVITCVDVTSNKQTEEALRRLTATLEERVEERTAQVRTLASTLTMAEQEERRRISQILHDDLQQLLYGVQMRAMSLITDLDADDHVRRTAYAQEIYAWLGDAIQTTRRLTVDLSPPVLQGEGLADALHWLARQMAEIHGLQVTIKAAHRFHLADEDMRVLLFQIVRELLFNVVKHAGADQAMVALEASAGEKLRVVISDEGRGFDVARAEAAHAGGFGLFSVRERLGLFGGQMEIDSAPGQGTRITLTVPVTITVQTPAPPDPA